MVRRVVVGSIPTLDLSVAVRSFLNSIHNVGAGSKGRKGCPPVSSRDCQGDKGGAEAGDSNAGTCFEST